jgi:DivIVA domain-containing protein
MDGTPRLITDVKFTERRRGGYEPDEVNNFLEQIAEKVAKLQDMLRRATAQTDEAEARAVEAQRARSEAEARAEQLESELGQERQAGTQRAHDAETEAEQASRVLLMAQKTADATIEDANRTAQQTVAEARSKATHLVIESEAEAARMRTDAERETQELIAQRQAAVLAEVHDLEEARDTVGRDVDVLQAFLAEQRSRLRAGIDELQRLLDDPAAFRDRPLPETSSTTAPPAEAVEESAEPDEVAEDSSQLEQELVDTGAPDDDLEELEEVEEIDTVVSVDDDAESAPSEDDFPRVVVPEIIRGSEVDDEPSEIDLTASELFSGSDEPGRAAAERREGGPPTELFSPFVEREADDPLGPPDAEADAAMRAFFDANFDESDEEAAKQRSRFGFRR